MKLTVLMPVYNGSEHIEIAIKSILKQTYKNFEFLIVNDGSTDKTEDIILSFKDTRINYKKIEHSGISNALNYGIKNASGDYIARMDSDDISLLNRLEYQVKEANKDPSISVLSNWYVHMKNYKVFRIIRTPLNNAEIKKELLKHSVICHASSFLKKSDIANAGMYNPEYDGLEDYELWLRGLRELKFKNLPQILYCVNDYGKKEVTDRNKGILSDLTNKYANEYKADENDKVGTVYRYGTKEQLRSLSFPGSNPKTFLRYLYSFAPQSIYNRKVDLWFFWKAKTLNALFAKDKYRIDKEIKEIISN